MKFRCEKEIQWNVRNYLLGGCTRDSHPWSVRDVEVVRIDDAKVQRDPTPVCDGDVVFHQLIGPHLKSTYMKMSYCRKLTNSQIVEHPVGQADLLLGWPARTGYVSSALYTVPKVLYSADFLIVPFHGGGRRK